MAALGRLATELLRAAYVPFGAGVHKCIGDGFARAEMAVVVGTIAARWRLSPDPDRPIRQRVRATFRPSSLWLVPRPRVPVGATR